jgi:6-phosphogluconate dehydrogenase
VIILVKAGSAVDDTIAGLSEFMEPGDTIIDGGNEWYENTERREAALKAKGLLYMGMGVSGGEEGARNGPSMMPGGSRDAYARVADVVAKVSAQVDDGACVTYIGPGGAGNFVKMVHNGIEYGDMQLISEAYDMLKTVGGLTNVELAAAFADWNAGDLNSFLVEITAQIFAREDDQKPGGAALVDWIQDKTGMKGTGKWTVQQGAELSVAAPTIASALDGRFLSGLKDERVAAAAFLEARGVPAAAPPPGGVNKAQLVADVRAALYASKICSYAQGMNLIRAKSAEQGWALNLGELARIWKGGCIIRAAFLGDIKAAYDLNPALDSLLIDPFFAKGLAERQAAWRRVVGLGVSTGVAMPGMSASLAYFDSYRRARMPANLVQAQRDYFGSHTYERTDMPGWHHTLWSDANSADSITTTGYTN